MKNKFLSAGLFLFIFHFANSQKTEAGSVTDGTITAEKIIIHKSQKKI